MNFPPKGLKKSKKNEKKIGEKQPKNMDLVTAYFSPENRNSQQLEDILWLNFTQKFIFFCYLGSLEIIEPKFSLSFFWFGQ